MKERAQCLQCKIGLNGVIPELGHLLNHKLFNKVTTKYPFNIKLDECLRKVKPVDMVQGKKKVSNTDQCQKPVLLYFTPKHVKQWELI